MLVPWGHCYDDNYLPSELHKCVIENEYLESKKFSQLMHTWSGTDGPVPALLRARYFTFYNIVHNMNAPYKGRLASIKWRTRGADRWSDMNPDALPPVYENSSNGNENSTRYDPRTIAAADFAMQELQSLSERALDQTTKMLQDSSKYMSDLENTFRESYPTSSNFYNQTQTNMDSIENQMNIPFEDWKNFDVNWPQNHLEEIKETKKKDAEKILMIQMMKVLRQI